ncbi:MAG: exodeoxyribonuclease VII large subunit [Bacillota bacterium]
MKIISVSQLTSQIKMLIEQSAVVNNVWIRGEISNFKRHISGHCYFTLKDSQSVIKSVMFKSRADGLRFVPNNGMNVIVNGRVSVYERDGNYQLYVDKILPDGVGELWLSIEQLREKLNQEGLFAQSRKRPLPLLPLRVCVISSQTGAVIKDILSVANKRNPAVQIILFPAQVQGLEAVNQICAALAVINSACLAEVVIIARGGGSLEDMQAFNDERLIRAVANSVIPVVSAVGHETDFTLCDAVADLRAATPSQAAELVVPSRQELFAKIEAKINSLRFRLKSTLEVERKTIFRLTRQKSFARPQTNLEKHRLELDNKLELMTAECRKYLVGKHSDYDVQCGKLAMLNPIAVLRRGFAVVNDDCNQTIKSILQLKLGTQVSIRLIDGKFSAKITKIISENDYEKKD